VSKQRGARLVIVLASIVVIGAGIKLAAPFLVPVLVAAFIAIVTAPIVLWFCDRGLPRLLAVLAGLLLDIAAAAVLAVPLSVAVATFTARLPLYADQLADRMQEVSLWLVAHNIRLGSLFDLSEPSWLVNKATTMAQWAASLISQMVLVLLIVAFMLFEATGIREKLSRLATQEQIARVSAAAHEVNAYLVAKTLMSLLTGVLVFLWCWWQGLDVPLLWGLLAYLLNYIPNIGQIIAAVPALLLGLIQLGPGQALVLAAGYGGINLLLGAVEPRVMGGALRLSALVVLVSMVAWGWLLGPVGALLSGPLTMVIKHTLYHNEDLRWMAELLGPTPRPAGRDGGPKPDELASDPAQSSLSASAARAENESRMS
jgi:AI-2 transport protein TqsA